MGLNTWAAFAGTDADAMVAGDVAMLEHEVTPVLKALRANGINVVAIHHHMTDVKPVVDLPPLLRHGSGSEVGAGRARRSRPAWERVRPIAGDSRTSRLSQRHRVGTRWKSKLPRRIVRGTVHRLGHVGLRRHRRHLRK